MESYIWAAIILSLIVSGITLIICEYCRKKFIKYAPTILMLISTLYCLFKLTLFSEGIINISYFILFIINLLAFICSFGTLVTLTLVKRYEKKSSKHHQKK